jgi:hypothetical protein
MDNDTRWILPVPSTALLDGGVALEKRLGREVALRFSYESTDDSVRVGAAVFQGVEAFKCTYMGALDPSMLKAYDRLLDRGSTPWLQEVSANLKRGRLNTDGLVHLMITFDDGPCYEFVCRSFLVEE